MFQSKVMICIGSFKNNLWPFFRAELQGDSFWQVVIDFQLFPSLKSDIQTFLLCIIYVLIVISLNLLVGTDQA